jgi:hypothetical protein
MPSLNWIGKDAVVKHHKEVPFRLLEPVAELSCCTPVHPSTGSGRTEERDTLRPESVGAPTTVRAELVEAPSTVRAEPFGRAQENPVGAQSGNLIVQGDNLHALKALLPRYAGQVKCIYIDPPYNTGNEG